MKILTLVALLTGLSCSPAQAEKEEWRTFTAPDGSYTIQLPSKPTEVTRETIYLVASDLSSPQRTFAIQRITLKVPWTPAQLESTQTGFLRFCEHNKGKVLSHDLKPFKGYRASFVVYEMDGQHVESLSVASHKYVFNVSLTRPLGDADFSVKERALFPGSFSIKEK